MSELSDPPRQKRRRTAQACSHCRAKKQKCDGKQPSCTPCKDMNRKCAYPLDSAGRLVDKVVVDVSYLRDLEAMARLYRRDQARLAGRATSSEAVEGLNSLGATVRCDAKDVNQVEVPGIFDSTNTGVFNGSNALGGPSLVSDQRLKVDSIPDWSSLSQLSNDLDGGPSLWNKASGNSHYTAHPFTHTVARDCRPKLLDPPSHSVTPDSENDMDGMGTFPSVGPGDSTSSSSVVDKSLNLAGIISDVEYYGDTSGIRFHSVLLDSLLPGYQCLIGCEDPSSRHRGSDFPRWGFLGLPFETERHPDFPPISRSDLPSMSIARATWSIFASQVHALYPFVSIDMLCQSYGAFLKVVQQWEQGGLESENPFKKPVYQPLLALHFSIFALVKAVAPDQCYGMIDNAHSISLQLLRTHQDWPHGTLKVQALLHGVILMQSVDCPGHSWNLLGYAVRSAYAVGLHQSANLINLPPLDRELRCRAWWGCFIFDRLLSVTIGRPSAITVTEPDFPMVEPLRGEQQSSIAFFRESIRLYVALSDLVANPTVMTAPSRSSIQTLEAAASATTSLEMAYAKWCDTITPELKADLGENHFIPPLTLALALRGTTMRLLLHRPVLLTYIRDLVGSKAHPQPGVVHSEGRLVRALGEKKHELAVGVSLAAVIETATTTVRLLDSGGVGPGSLSPPWYQLFYAMNAFMSLVATFLIDLSKWELFIQTKPAEIVQTLHTIHMLVEQVSEINNRPPAKRALELVRQVLRTLGLFKEDSSVASKAAQVDPDMAWPTNPSNGDLGFTNVLQPTPQLEFDDLYKLLEIGMGGRSSDQPTPDWFGMFGSSG